MRPRSTGRSTLMEARSNEENTTDSFLLAGMTNWTSGSFLGTGTEVNIGTINLTGTGYHGIAASSTFVNDGSFNLGGTLTQGDQYGPGALTNNAGATLDFQAGGVFDYGTLTNSGTIAKSLPGSATITDDTTFINQSGTIKVSAGTFFFDPAGTITSPTFLVATGAEVEVDEGSNWTGTISGSGGGLFNLNMGYFNGLNADGATFAFSTGMLEWSQEIFTATGPTLVTSPFPFPSPRRTSPIFPANSTTAGRSNLPEPSTSATNTAPGALTNNAGATLDFQAGGVFDYGTLTNSGTIAKSLPGSATITDDTTLHQSVRDNQSQCRDLLL